MKKGRRPRRRPRLKLSDKAGPDQCPVPGENALFPAQIAGFLAVSRAVPVYPVFLNYVVPVHRPVFPLSLGNLYKHVLTQRWQPVLSEQHTTSGFRIAELNSVIRLLYNAIL